MAKIDTRKWKEFKLGELFYIRTSKSVDKINLNLGTDGEYDFIGRTALNNGIQGKIEQLDFDSNPKGTYSIAQIGENVCLYRECDWYSSQNIFCLTPINPLMNIANKFLTTVITKTLKTVFGEDAYSSYPTLKTLPLLKIKLPVTSENLPDYAYMEEYMRRLEDSVSSSLTALQSAQEQEKKKIDVSGWGEFRIGDLFEKCELKCLKVDFNKAIDISAEKTDEFSLPLVNAKHSNNGIMYYGRESDWDSAEMTIDIVEDGASSTGDVYAQPQKTGVLYNAYLIKPKFSYQSKYILQYMACVMQRCVKSHFGYENKCTWDKVKKENIKLPVAANGEPDWDYMENYMKAVQTKPIEILNSIL